MEALKQYLKSRPDIQDVYLNDQGEWIFSPNKHFPIHKTRKAVLEGEDTAVVGEDVINTIKSLEEKNRFLSDQTELLQLEKEDLQKQVEALQQQVNGLESAIAEAKTTEPEPPAETQQKPDSKSGKTK